MRPRSAAQGALVMLFLTRWFGVTGSDAERDLAAEAGLHRARSSKSSLLMQANAAAKQHRPLGRGTHAKGVCVRAQFEVFDVAAGRDPALAARLAKGIFAKPGIYPATVRFGNADPNVEFRLQARRPIVVLLGRPHSRTERSSRSRTSPGRISPCKTPRLCPSTTPARFWRS